MDKERQRLETLREQVEGAGVSRSSRVIIRYSLVPVGLYDYGAASLLTAP